jgi:hypothetical protein
VDFFIVGQQFGKQPYRLDTFTKGDCNAAASLSQPDEISE